MRKILFLCVVFFHFVYPVSHVYFTPRDNIKNHLIDLIKQERKSIDGAVYMFTDKKIAEALIEAYVRGVKVTLVLDQISMGRFGKGELLQQGGIMVYIHKTAHFNSFTTPIMHHKFLLFGMNGVQNKALLWTGSFNCTASASKLNYENVLVSDEQEVIKQYKECFCELVHQFSSKKELCT